MSALVIAEHDHRVLKPATLTTVSAARKLDESVTVLVAGHQCRTAAESAAKVQGVAKVLLCEGVHYDHQLAEDLAALVASFAREYTHVLAPATTFGKNLLPRVAALLDVAQVSDIVAVEGADTFVRPIYAGNALATVRSNAPVKVITVRSTAFDAAPAQGGTAPIETLPPVPPLGVSRFVGQELTKSERPELTAAHIVISGGRGHLGLGDDAAGARQLLVGAEAAGGAPEELAGARVLAELAMAMPRRASAGGSSRRPTRLRAPSASPTTRARAAAAIRESIATGYCAAAGRAAGAP